MKKKLEFKNQITRLQFLVTFSSYTHDNILLDFAMLANPLDLLATSVSCDLCHESANDHYPTGYQSKEISQKLNIIFSYNYEGIST